MIYEKINKVTPVLRIIWVKMIFLSSHITVQHFTVSSTLLCSALYCVQHITVSSTLLCTTKNCVHTDPKGLLFTFHISMCCGRIMLRLRSTSVSLWYNKFVHGITHSKIYNCMMEYFFLTKLLPLCCFTVAICSHNRNWTTFLK